MVLMHKIMLVDIKTHCQSDGNVLFLFLNGSITNNDTNNASQILDISKTNNFMQILSELDSIWSLSCHILCSALLGLGTFILA